MSIKNPTPISNRRVGYKFHGKNKWSKELKPTTLYTFVHNSGITAKVIELPNGLQVIEVSNLQGKIEKTIKVVDRNGDKICNPDYIDIIYSELTNLKDFQKYIRFH